MNSLNAACSSFLSRRNDIVIDKQSSTRCLRCAALSCTQLQALYVASIPAISNALCHLHRYKVGRLFLFLRGRFSTRRHTLIYAKDHSRHVANKTNLSKIITNLSLFWCPPLRALRRCAGMHAVYEALIVAVHSGTSSALCESNLKKGFVVVQVHMQYDEHDAATSACCPLWHIIQFAHPC